MSQKRDYCMVCKQKTTIYYVETKSYTSLMCSNCAAQWQEVAEEQFEATDDRRIGGFRRAKGCLIWEDGHEAEEDMIRRLRDGTLFVKEEE